MIGRRLWAFSSVAALVSALASLGSGGWLFGAHGPAARTDRAIALQSSRTTALSLSATITQSDLRLTWNPGATCIQEASVGALSVTDAGTTETVEIGAAALKRGAIGYAPIGRDVAFRLSIDGPDASRSCLESVLILNRSASAN